jgi:RHS repeat-associated protein
MVGTVSAQEGAAGDVFDQFHRHAEGEHKAFLQEMPGEVVDPFTGNLRIIRTDVVLPGKAGLDLRVVRAYSSKIWGRADLLDTEPLLAEKEHSVLGYGWTFHMGRLRNPNAITPTVGCGGEFPVYEEPDGTSHVFYPVAGSDSVYVSKDFWRMENSCAALSGAGACVWSDTGVRYELSSYYDNQFFYGATIPIWPVSRIVDLYGNSISMSYLSQTGAVRNIVDTYGRTITFEYTSDVDGLRLDSMTAGSQVYRYVYARRTPAETGGVGRIPLSTARRFLTEVRPPVGPPELYEYAYSATVEQNQYALSSITLPTGAATNFTYGPVSFFTGRDSVTFAVVLGRSVMGRGIPNADWTYSYNSPGPGQEFHITTVTRPDGKHDKYTIIGFGYVAGRSSGALRLTYGVGLPLEIDKADGAEQEGYQWDVLQDATGAAVPISSAPYSAPVYSGSCGPYYVWDPVVYVPVMKQRWLWRDGAIFGTQYSSFDDYGQPRLVIETGKQSGYTEDSLAAQYRTTMWTYFSDPSLNILRARPLAQHVCVGSGCVDYAGNPVTQHACAANECFDNSWTYSGPNHARDSETLSGVKTTFGYHLGEPEGPGNLCTLTNALGQTLTLSGYFEGYGTPTHINFNNAFSIDRTTSWEGWIRTETNGRGHTTGYEYDAIGRNTMVTPPGNNNATGYTYADDGSWVRLARGRYFKNTYLDGLGRVTSTADSEGIQTSVRYDNMGQASFHSYPWDSSTGEVGERLDRDGLGRVVTRTKAYRPSTNACDAPGACSESAQYVGNCRSLTVQRAVNDGPRMWHCFRSFGNPDERRITEVSDASGSLWRYVYNSAGMLQAASAPVAQGSRSYEYSPVTNFLESETSGESGPTRYGRNAIGQMTTRTDARGITAVYGYSDPLSRLRSVTYQGGSPDDVTKDYDNSNNVARVSSTNGGAVDYVYDELNRVIGQQWSYQGKTYTTIYHYDPTGCLNSVVYPSGVVLTAACDTLNRVRSLSLGSTIIVNNITYDASGQVKRMTYGNGKASVMSYDDRARMKTASCGGVMGLSYGYDGAGNVISILNTVVSNATRTMQYDVLDRLTSMYVPYEVSAGYEYDALGNLMVKSDDNYTTNYGYDQQSNRLTSAEGGSGSLPSMTFTWDPAGRLASASDGTTYRYDGLGRRVQKAQPDKTTVYHYDAGGRIIAETLPDGTKLRDYIYLGNRLVAISGCVEGLTSSTCDGIQWYHTDALGSVLARTDASGAVVSRFDYQPWGERWSVSGVQGDRQYNGRVFDQGTGFHDYGARMYWPQIGRFISPDTAGPDLANPASLNRYSYTFNNPYKYTDPDGHNPLLVTAGIGAGLGAVYGAYTSYQAEGKINWRTVANDAAIGGMIGLTAGVAGPALAGAIEGSGAAAAGAGAAAGAAAAQRSASASSGALSSEGQALMRAGPVGSALKDDLFHRAATFMREAAARTGTSFQLSGADGTKSTLTQVTGDLNGQGGRYEYIVNSAGELTHQMFVAGGSINGTPIAP